MEWFKPVKKTTRNSNTLLSFGPRRNTKPFNFGLTPKKVVKSKMNWGQAKIKYPKLNPFGDVDKDGVINMFDCQPFNKKKQGSWHRKAGYSIEDMYDFARRTPGTEKRKSGRDIIRKDEDKVAVRLHQTDIAVLDPKRNILKIQTGGWETPTTKERINKALPEDMSVFQERHRWKVKTPEGVVPFEEGMEIQIEGRGKKGRILRQVSEEPEEEEDEDVEFKEDEGGYSHQERNLAEDERKEYEEELEKED